MPKFLLEDETVETPPKLHLERDGEMIHLKADYWYILTINEDGTIQRIAGVPSYIGFKTNMGMVVLKDEMGTHPLEEPAYLIKNYIKNGERIKAIKEYRSAFNASLKEAKDAVEAIERAF